VPLRVVVTRPAAQAPALVAALEARGDVVIAVPLVEIVEPDDPRPFHDALARLERYDWVVVTSPNGAARVAAALAAAPAGAPRVAAVGAATAATLGRADLVPAEQRAAGLVAEFPTGPGSVLVVQAEGGAPTLETGLRDRGWRVDRVHSHRSRHVVPTARQQLEMLRSDALVLTSGSQAGAWAAVFGRSTPPVVVAMGPQTAHDAARAGLKVDVVAADHSVAGVVAALHDHVAIGRIGGEMS